MQGKEGPRPALPTNQASPETSGASKAGPGQREAWTTAPFTVTTVLNVAKPAPARTESTKRADVKQNLVEILRHYEEAEVCVGEPAPRLAKSLTALGKVADILIDRGLPEGWTAADLSYAMQDPAFAGLGQLSWGLVATKYLDRFMRVLEGLVAHRKSLEDLPRRLEKQLKANMVSDDPARRLDAGYALLSSGRASEGLPFVFDALRHRTLAVGAAQVLHQWSDKVLQRWHDDHASDTPEIAANAAVRIRELLADADLDATIRKQLEIAMRWLWCGLEPDHGAEKWTLYQEELAEGKTALQKLLDRGGPSRHAPTVKRGRQKLETKHLTIR